MNKLTKEYAMSVLREHLTALAGHLDDESIQEIMVNDPDNIFAERRGEITKLEGIALSDEGMDAALNILANVNDRESTQIMDARLPGLRIAGARTPTAMRGNMVCIRRHSSTKFTLRDYVASGQFNVLERNPLWDQIDQAEKKLLSELRHGGQAVADFLQWAVQTRKNLVLSGATSSGKTTLLNSLIREIPKEDRLITIEDTGELQVGVPNYVSFETNPILGVSVRDLVKHALRCRPDRIVVGEIRGAEAFDLMDALNTGHPGSGVSFHADSSAGALPRLESMLRMAPEAQNWPLADLRRQIAITFPFIVHAQRVGGQRGPQEIRQILGAENGVYQTRLLYSKIPREDAAYA
jgi:Flp pilus assembly CpaF family ATPase